MIALVGLIELLGAAACIPYRLKTRQRATDLAKIHAVAALVRTSAFGILDPAIGNGLSDNFGELANLIVFFVDAHVESLIVNQLAWRFECGQEAARNILDVHN